MDRSKWQLDEVQKLAQSSGKPLEVTTAAAFLHAGWRATLGTYFIDRGVPRELDVLAVRDLRIAHRHNDVTLRLRAQVSCKGFRPHQGPVTYSLSKTDKSLVQPRLQVWRRLPVSNLAALAHFEGTAATWLLRHCDLHEARPVVALDVVEWEKNAKQLKPKSDKVLYEGVDSAVKATLHWMRHDPQQSDGYCVTLYVSVLVLLCEFLDVCIDGGTAAYPQPLRRGYQTFLYPGEGVSMPMVCLVWTKDELGGLVAALDGLFDDFSEEMERFLTNAT